KTFFMHAMRQSVAARAARGIVQLEFNAWHYTDANTMGSLVRRVFDAISDTAGERGDPLFGKLQLGTELLDTAQGAGEESLAQRDALARDLESLNERMQQLQVPKDPFSSPAVQKALAIHQVKDLVERLTGVAHPSIDMLGQILPTTSGLFGAIRL